MFAGLVFRRRLCGGAGADRICHGMRLYDRRRRSAVASLSAERFSVLDALSVAAPITDSRRALMHADIMWLQVSNGSPMVVFRSSAQASDS
jgi:hypothetical protein